MSNGYTEKFKRDKLLCATDDDGVLMISLLIDLFAVMLYKKLLSQATLVYILEYGVFFCCLIFFAVGGQKRKYVIWSLH